MKLPVSVGIGALLLALSPLVAWAEGGEKTGAPIEGRHTFAIGEESFLLDGRPFVIRCAEMHFARVPRALWRHRLRMLHACGFNAVCAYMFWNYHEPVRGRFDFAGEKDVAAFCREAQAEGLWVVLRPGPYTCAEWEFGGLPWWLLKEKGIRLRSTDPRFLAPSRDYFAAVGGQLRDCQVTRGGNILMVQVENEYAFWGEDKAYMRAQYRAMREASGFDIPAFGCNPSWAPLDRGYIPELFPVVNFGSNPQEAFDRLREKLPKGPFMCGEYYPAWYDSWGEPHSVKPADGILADLACMLDMKASFSVYMAHGGTTFGWWSGCNAPFRPQTSSYDFDAPVSESGRPHPVKFAAFRDLFARHLNPGETIPEPPAARPMQEATVTAKPRFASVFDAALPAVRGPDPLTFEQLDFGYGLAVYETTVPSGWGGELKADVRDLGVVRLDGREIGFFDRRHAHAAIAVDAADRPRRLEILVEPMGRYNFGHIMHEAHKGIVGEVTLGGKVLADWTMRPFDWLAGTLDRLAWGQAPAASVRPAGGFWRYRVPLAAEDTYLDMRAWRRGLVFVNGHALGRYWSIGPTQTMFVPGCWLRDGENEIVVWDAVGGTEPTETFVFRKEPVLGELRPETDYFAWTPRPKLAEPLAGPAAEGEFARSIDRQTVRFDAPRRGRYFALESLDAWDGAPYAAGGEIDLLDGEGRDIPHSKWTIAACDSEEGVTEDGSAENLVDGQTANRWHTERNDAPPRHPHYVVIDLGRDETVGGFVFTPVQSATDDGRIRHYRAYVKEAVQFR